MKRILLSLAFLMTSSLALASGGGGGDGGGAASSILKLDPLVVNLSGGHFLQFTPSSNWRTRRRPTSSKLTPLCCATA
jgi:hypothetical protein